MSETFILGIFTFILVLGPLVILHELGHLITARKFGVKTLEFGFGFPPRLFSYWTGNTVIYKDEKSVFPFQVGSIISVIYNDSGDNIILERIKNYEKKDDSSASSGEKVIIGKIKSISSNSFVVADMMWSFNLLPLGGFVRMVGEENSSATGSLASKTKLQRIIVMSAGAIINLIIPFILLTTIFMIPSEKEVSDVTIVSVFPDSPASLAGLRSGDKIIKVDNRDINSIQNLQQSVMVKLGSESTWEIETGIPNLFARPSENMYQYSGDVKKIKLIPRWNPPKKQVVENVYDESKEISVNDARAYNSDAGINNILRVVSKINDPNSEIELLDAQKYIDSISLNDQINIVNSITNPSNQILVNTARAINNLLGSTTLIQEGATGVQIRNTNTIKKNSGENILKAFLNAKNQIFDTLILTKNAVFSNFQDSSIPQFEGPQTVGPIGIGQLTGEIAVSENSFYDKVIWYCSLAATLSLSLGIINLLPIPALDGGRILFVVIEIIRGGKKISPEREGLVHLLGFILLLSLIAVISIQDITRIVSGDRIF
ncbi:MAG: site-2 protease family protein [Dehalococcoidia bacterium]